MSRIRVFRFGFQDNRTFRDIVDVEERILSRRKGEERAEMHVLAELLEVLQLGLNFEVSLSNLLSSSTFEERISCGGFVQNVVGLTIWVPKDVSGCAQKAENGSSASFKLIRIPSCIFESATRLYFKAGILASNRSTIIGRSRQSNSSQTTGGKTSKCPEDAPISPFEVNSSN